MSAGFGKTSQSDFILGTDSVETKVSPDDTTSRSIAHLAMLAGNACFPPDSWPWTLARESSLTVIGKGQYTIGELQKICASDSSGPVCFLTASGLLRYVNAPASRFLAARGLEKLSLADFRKDYRLLLDDHCTVARTVERMAVAFRAMSDQEVERAAKLYAGAGGQVFSGSGADAAVRSQEAVEAGPLRLLRRLLEGRASRSR